MKSYIFLQWARHSCRAFLIVLSVAFLGLGFASCSPVRAQEKVEPVAASPEYPTTGLKAIFRPDFPFKPAKNGKVDPASIPPTRFGCGVKVLGRLEDNFNLRFQLLEAAQKTIWIETYIFTGDEIGYRAADILIKKRQAGVDVRLIVDAYTKLNPRDQKLFLYMERNGIFIRGFEPVYLLTTGEHVYLNAQDVNQRFHEKYWVLDHQAAIMGGTNIANEYARYGDEPKSKWRDQDLVVTGPIIQDVARAFEQNYEYFTDRQEERLPWNQPWNWAQAYRRRHDLPEPPSPDPQRQPAALTIPEMTDENIPIRFVRARPRHEEDYVTQALLHLFKNAKKSLLLETAYFVPSQELLQTLIETARRGVQVTIVTNCDKTNDVAGMPPLVRYSYLPLMDAGITIYEWQGDHPGFGSMHAKCAAIDGELAVIGSPNLDPRSLNINAESMLIMDSAKAAAALSHFIETVDLPVSKKITHEQAVYWRRPQQLNDIAKLLFAMSIEPWY